MKRRYESFLNLGIHEDLPVYESKLVRFTNFLESFSLCFYLLYAAIGFFLHSPFCVLISLFLFLFGITGIWFNYKRHYLIARSFFTSSFSIGLFLVCNSLNIGSSFFPFFFTTFISFALYYNLEEGALSGILNLALTVLCSVCSYALPHYLFWKVELEYSWAQTLAYLNYTVAIAVTLNFIFFILSHINKTGKKLVEDFKEEYRQKMELVEAKMKAEAAAQAKSRFLSNISHEMRTPLNGIVGTVNLLLQEPFLPEQEQSFNVLKYSSEHMLRVVNDVLDFSKIEADKMELSGEIFNLAETMNKLFLVFDPQFREKNIQLEIRTAPALNEYFQADETRIRQVLTNLIGNALKFTEQGSVCVEVKPEELSDDKASVTFSVEDTGIGLSKQQELLIFDAFSQAESSTTRKFGGTGLGLSISQKIVEMLKGEIKVISEPGKGSRFFFTITLPLAKKGFINEKKVSQLNSLKDLKILVAEDSQVNMTITRKFLQRWDIDMHEAINGKEALVLFRQNKYHLLLIDLDMPEMDGYEVIKEIRKTDPDIPAIAFTAAVLPDMEQQLSVCGFNGLLQKPFKPEDLHRKIVMYTSYLNHH